MSRLWCPKCRKHWTMPEGRIRFFTPAIHSEIYICDECHAKLPWGYAYVVKMPRAEWERLQKEGPPKEIVSGY